MKTLWRGSTSAGARATTLSRSSGTSNSSVIFSLFFSPRDPKKMLKNINRPTTRISLGTTRWVEELRLERNPNPQGIRPAKPNHSIAGFAILDGSSHHYKVWSELHLRPAQKSAKTCPNSLKFIIPIVQNLYFPLNETQLNFLFYFEAKLQKSIDLTCCNLPVVHPDYERRSPSCRHKKRIFVC